MVPQEFWLALKLLDRDAAGVKRSRKPFLISIPRKVVPLATARNRIRRVLREAIRAEGLPPGGNGVYLFQVKNRPEKVDLETARRALGALLKAL
ncbi:MAG: ribonuclease P protein component [Candidatus Omnitrophica bacterium]|nr:ribonuclease P protein component [Candidatus Omnitrophota bacterium]